MVAAADCLLALREREPRGDDWEAWNARASVAALLIVGAMRDLRMLRRLFSGQQ